MQQYQIIRIDPQVQTRVDRKPKYDPNTGVIVGYDEVQWKYVVAHATDGMRSADSALGNPLNEYCIAAPPGYLDPGDIVEGFDNCGWLASVVVVKGKNAIPRPAPAKSAPAPAVETLPEPAAPATPTWMGSVMNGCPMSGQDLREFCAWCLDLAQRHKNLAAAFRKYVAEHP